MELLDKAGRKRLHDMARHLAFQRAVHECPEQLAKDLEQAAYLKLMTLQSRKHVWKDLQYAMLEELSRWVYGCKRGRGKNRVLRFKMGLGNYVKIQGKPYTLEQVLV